MGLKAHNLAPRSHAEVIEAVSPPLSHCLPGAAALSLTTRSSHSLSGQEGWTFWPACHPTYVVPKPSWFLWLTHTAQVFSC